MLAVEEELTKGDVFDASKEGGLNVKTLRDVLMQITMALKYFRKNLPVCISLYIISYYYLSRIMLKILNS